VSEREPTTQTLNVTDARQQFSQVLNQVFRRETRVVVEKNGIPVAAIISAEDLRLLDRLEARERERAERFATLDEVREALRDAPDDELEREVTKALESARRERRTQSQQGEPAA
jgi:prevent-host-death family protein